MTALSPQNLTITMADRNYSLSGENAQVHLQAKPSSVSLVLDVGIPGRLNMTLVWDKHMSISIRVHRASQVPTAWPGHTGQGQGPVPGGVDQEALPPLLTPSPAGGPLWPVWQRQREHEGRL